MSNTVQRNFSGGEVSASQYARTDLPRYATALRTCRNFLCLKHGGVTNRPGTELVHLSLGVSRLLPFVFNDAQSYVLEFSANVIRIVQDAGSIGVAVDTPYGAADLPGLQITQSADVLTLVHASYPVMALKRLSALAWTLTPVVFDITVPSPTGVALSPSSTHNGDPRYVRFTWVVTAVSENGSESLPSGSVTLGISEVPVGRTVTWSSVAGAVRYNIYKASGGGGFGYVGTSNAPYFFDNDLTADTADQPPVARPLFDAPGNYPSAIGNYQQRRWLAGTNAAPETVWSSRTGDVDNFAVSSPTQDDDAITATLVAKKVNAIRHLVDSTKLFLFTSGGEAVVRGDGSGVVRPTDINVLTFSRHGCSTLPPIVTEDAIVFVQARQSVIREIVEADVAEKYDGRDLTIFATHLFLGHTIVDWAYQEVPTATIWCVRSDGVLLGLTYVNDQQILAWHRHDTDGRVESICVIPEGGEDRLYLVVNRAGVRMLERMASRNVVDIQDAIFMDAALTYDGRNHTSETMTLSGGSSWDFDAPLTCTRSRGGFVPEDVGNEIVFAPSDGLALRLRITAVVSAMVVHGFPTRLVPSELRGTATAVWSRAVNSFAGLTHLEGRALAVTGDGYVVASPNNPDYVQRVVTGGVITVPTCYAYVHAGLPYVSDLETLDIDTPSGASLKDAKMKVSAVTVYVEASRGFFAGQSLPAGSDLLAQMDEAKVRDATADYGLIALVTDTIGVTIPAEWNSNGRVAIRNVDPLPLTMLAVIPRGHLSQQG